MDRDRLVLGLAAVFAGLTVVLVVVAFVRQLFLLFLALPFAATTYLMWKHATGRIEARARQRVRTGPQRGARRRDARRRVADGVGARSSRGTSRTAPSSTQSLSRREAYDILGLDSDASDDAVKRAYRAKVKEVHPDADGGDEAAFKRVKRAYERLQP
ncbi:DnaJ domain-containing protein [Haloplanus vescus]|uniref:DnaJ domain-containing protein n=1 Tax=Haloplanus vescus TaxID=555874 RepID=A0A1H4AIB1_9EURY|nr:J domain-containing protein [Haloplanus vescus]SEA35488.1 DnaJ domain-containing protein [Haloplanus vescus]